MEIIKIKKRYCETFSLFPQETKVTSYGKNAFREAVLSKVQAVQAVHVTPTQIPYRKVSDKCMDCLDSLDRRRSK